MNWSRKTEDRYRALLIFPRREGVVYANDAFFPFPFLGLTQVAAMFPSHWEVRILDERISPLRKLPHADLVMMTTLTTSVLRAYELADGFRSAGVPVVLGGVHATVLPEEAAAHADSLVIGEAEGVFDQLIADFEKGCLQPQYEDRSRPDLEGLAIPAVGLLNWRHRFFLSALQTSRGCPKTCEFCSVPATFGHKLRNKSIGFLDREVAEVTKLGSKRLFLVDDNLTVDQDRAREVFAVLKKHKVKWMGFSNLSAAKDPSFLQAMSESGCISLFVGFESLQPRSLHHKNDRWLGGEMESAVREIHNRKISIQGSFIFGFDEDDPSVFRGVVDFIQKNRIEVPNISILTPYPGTLLFRRLEEEGRILHRNWDEYDMSHVVFQPAGMTKVELQQGYAWALKYLASPSSILKRIRPGSTGYGYNLIANFSLHGAHTRLARSLWDDRVHNSMTRRGYL